MKKIIYCLSLLLFFNCSSSEDITVEENIRENFLEGKSMAKVKQDFEVLTKEEKKKLWDDKLSHLISLNISAKHSNLLMSLRNKLKNDKYEVNEIQNIAIELALITPEEDFIMMFSLLNDYEYRGSFYGNGISITLIEELGEEKAFLNKKTENISNNDFQRKDACNCSWTCHFYGGGSTNCTPTSSGCGFMYLQACTKRAEMMTI